MLDNYSLNNNVQCNYSYFVQQTFYDDGHTSEGSESVFPTDHVVAVIGDHNTQYYPTLIHLVMADAAYAKDNGKVMIFNIILAFIVFLP